MTVVVTVVVQMLVVTEAEGMLLAAFVALAVVFMAVALE